MDDKYAFTLGESPDERLTIMVLGRTYPDTIDYWDGNWLRAEVIARAGSFKGRFDAALRTDELVRLLDELRRLQDNLTGEVFFAPMEPWIEARITADGRGHFAAECVARDDFALPRELRFTVTFDQTHLAADLRRLESIVASFPVVSAP